MGFQMRGVYTAIVTPFDERGDFDEATYRNLIDFQIENGVDGIVPCGTTGESPTLSHEEHDRVIEITVEHVNKRVPVVAGTGSNSTREAVQLTSHAKKAGVDGAMLVNPYYNKPTQRGLFLHFSEIAKTVDIPIMVYNIKGRTAVNLETDTLMELCDACPNIIAVKEASGDLEQMKSVISGRRDGFSVMSGDDNIALQLVKEGGDGVVSVASNLIPDRMVQMIHAGLKGDFKGADEMEAALAGFFQAMFVETNPIPIKTAMAMAGKCQEIFRLPMCQLATEENRKVVADALASL